MDVGIGLGVSMSMGMGPRDPLASRPSVRFSLVPEPLEHHPPGSALRLLALSLES